MDTNEARSGRPLVTAVVGSLVVIAGSTAAAVALAGTERPPWTLALAGPSAPPPR